MPFLLPRVVAHFSTSWQQLFCRLAADPSLSKGFRKVLEGAHSWTPSRVISSDRSLSSVVTHAFALPSLWLRSSFAFSACWPLIYLARRGSRKALQGLHRAPERNTLLRSEGQLLRFFGGWKGSGFGWKIFILLYINEMWKLQFDLLRLGTLFFERNTCQVLRLKKMSPLFFTSNEWFPRRLCEGSSGIFSSASRNGW